MEIRALNHVAMIVHDVEVSRRFYTQVLGMREIARPATFSFPGAWFTSGTAEVHLIGEGQPGRAAQLQPTFYDTELRRGYVPHAAFEVSDLATARAHLDALGVEVVGGPQPRGDGITQLYICDPDGYVLEIFAYDVKKS